MAEDESLGDEDMRPPQTWPGVPESMDGFPFPTLTKCSDPKSNNWIMTLSDGRAFYLHTRLNSSLFGAVYAGYSGRCTNPNDPNSFTSPPEQRDHVAIKMSSLRRLRQPTAENVFKEIAVMLELNSAPGMPHDCSYVMPLMAACLSRQDLFVVTPLCKAGDLLKRVTPYHGVEEPLLQRWFSQILVALAHIHSKNLCHHDLSPENVVITENFHAAVVMDFGMVQRLDRNEAGEVIPRIDPERFGKYRYMAPEIFRRVEYDGRKADLWSLGVMLLVCLSGEYPWEAPARFRSARFSTSDIMKFSCLERHGPAEMLRQMGLSSPRLSANALDLLCLLLVVKPEHRPSSALELVNHPFFTTHP